ncbi:DUF1351 domain-containing protein [Eggerthellaceae bacterium 24-137]
MEARSVEVVEAEVVESDLAPIGNTLSVNFEGLMARIAAMNDAIAEAKKVEGECAVDDEALAEMPLDDVKRMERGLSNAIAAAEAARKAFNGDYETPKKAVGAAYQEAMEPVNSLHGRYKAQRKETEESIKSARRAVLEDAYSEFMEGNGLTELAEAVPFERIAEDRWWNTVAKSWSETKAADAVRKRAMEVIKDYNAVKATAYHYPEQAQAAFFGTLSLREVAERDKAMWEEAQRVAAVNAEAEENRAYCEQAPEQVSPEACSGAPCEGDPVPDIVAEAEQVVAQAARTTYVICADLTECQYSALIDFFRSMGAHGVPIRTAFNGWEQASAMVKAVCNG